MFALSVLPINLKFSGSCNGATQLWISLSYKWWWCVWQHETFSSNLPFLLTPLPVPSTAPGKCSQLCEVQRAPSTSVPPPVPGQVMASAARTHNSTSAHSFFPSFLHPSSYLSIFLKLYDILISQEVTELQTFRERGILRNHLVSSERGRPSVEDSGTCPQPRCVLARA